ncbi:MAG: hypothetical protein FWE10_06400 [Rikenellaceae bacterium]|nr:hypothetical protein [Rikenellaceae bacterium]MCL2691806.1 hypothetical protein [Rikenellaceae bacterium]
MRNRSSYIDSDYRAAEDIAKELSETFFSNKSIKENAFLSDFFDNDPLAGDVKDMLTSAEDSQKIYDEMTSREKNDDVGKLKERLK